VEEQGAGRVGLDPVLIAFVDGFEGFIAHSVSPAMTELFAVEGRSAGR